MPSNALYILLWGVRVSVSVRGLLTVAPEIDAPKKRNFGGRAVVQQMQRRAAVLQVVSSRTASCNTFFTFFLLFSYVVRVGVINKNILHGG